MTDTPAVPPTPPAPAAPTPPPPPAPAPTTPAPATPSAAACPCTPFLPFVVLGGAFLLFVAFFVPWWSMTVTPPDFTGKVGDEKAMKEYQENSKEFDRVGRENRPWYRAHGVEQRMEDQVRGLKEAPKELGVSLFGWSTGTGVTAFIFTFFVAAFVLAPMFVPVIRPYAWMGYLVSAIMYFVIFMLSTIGWLMCSPGENLSPMMSQGISIGVWFAVFGSLAVTATAGMLGVKGLLSVIKGLQTKPA